MTLASLSPLRCAEAPAHATLVERLRWRAAVQPDDLAIFELQGLRTRGDAATYRQLDARARAVAAHLQGLSARGDRVMLVMENTLDYVVAFFACAYAGCVGVNVLPPSRPKHLARLAHVVADCEARVLVTSGPRAGELLGRLADDQDLRTLRTVRVDKVLLDLSDRYAPFTPSPEDPCHLQYTSGSTGAPRGVVVSHANLAVHGEALRRGFGFTAEDRALTWLPLYHDMGLILGVLQPIHTGFPVALTDPLSFVKRPDLWLRAISEHRITFAGGPNFCYDLCVDAVSPAELAGVDLSSWQVALNGAEPIRARTLERFNQAFAPLGWRPEAMQTSFGLAEFTLDVSTKVRGTAPVVRTVDASALGRGKVLDASADAPARRLVSSGRPAPETTIRVVNPDLHQPVAPGQIGEIWLSGPSRALGYWRQEALTRETFEARLHGDPAPYLRTGDLGFLEDGELFITGRLKDVVITHGANHYPQDLEETAELSDPAVRPHFVAIFADERGDREALVVVAEIRREAAGGMEVDRVAGRIALAIAREHDVQVDEVHLAHQGQVPKTTSGKIQRSACRALLVAGELKLHGTLVRGERR